MKSIRTCIVCKKKIHKSQLNRVFKNQENIPVLDTHQKAQARAVYICYNKQCHSNLYKHKVLNRAFKQNFSQDVYNQLAKTLKYE